MKQTQLLKGVLEGCVLAVIARRESYGYKIMHALRSYGFDSVVGGTLYPILAKLEKQAAITGTMKPSPDGPDRRYFTITAAGREQLAAFKLQWQQIGNQVAAVLREEDSDEQN